MRELVEIAKVEGEIEELKNDLLMQADFQVVSLFKIFDASASGRISIVDFMQGLKRLGSALQ